MSKVKNKLELTFHFNTGTVTSKPLIFPLAPFNSGTWTCSYDPDRQTAVVQCKDATTTVKVASVKLSTSIDAKPERRVVDSGLSGGPFPPSPNYKIYAKVNIPKFGGGDEKRWAGTAQLVVVLSAEASGDVVTESAVAASGGAVAVGGGRSEERALVRVLSATAALSVHKLGDVEFYFPATDQSLFVNSNALEHASPYFKTLLGPDLVAAEDDLASQVTTESFFNLADGNEEDDGATEAGSAVAAAAEVPSTPPNTVQHPATRAGQRIVVENRTFRLYRAVFVWLLADHIQFTPLLVRSLTSTPAIADPDSTSAPTSGLPAPVPAVSAIHLATVLHLPDLVALAADHYAAQLSVENAISELISDAALDEGVKEAILAYASKNWQAVRQTPLAAQLQKPGVLAALPNGAEIGARLFELARRC